MIIYPNFLGHKSCQKNTYIQYRHKVHSTDKCRHKCFQIHVTKSHFTSSLSSEFRSFTDRGMKEFLYLFRYLILYLIGTLQCLPDGSSLYSEYRTQEGPVIIFLAYSLRQRCSLTPITVIAVWTSLFINCDCDFNLTDGYQTKLRFLN